MPQSRTCLNFRASLEELRTLKEAFFRSYHPSLLTTRDDRESLANAKRHFEEKYLALRKRIDTADIEQFASLRKQYDAQIALLKKANILESDPERVDVYYIRGCDGRRYDLPPYSEVIKKLFSRRELLAVKADQGFTKLLLVPIAARLSEFVHKFTQHLERYQQTWGHASGLSSEGCVDVYEELITKEAEEGMLYYPKEFKADQSGGQTKRALLDERRQAGESIVGWDIILLQEDDEGDGIRPIPQPKKGDQCGKVRPRGDIETGRNASAYLLQMTETQNNTTSPYAGEVGLTLETWMIACMTELETTGKILDEDENLDGVMLTGAYVVRSDTMDQTLPPDFIPSLYFMETTKRYTLNTTVPMYPYGKEGVRNGVLL